MLDERELTAIVYPVGIGKSFNIFKLEDEEIAEVQPYIAIYDEFHRTGAEMWLLGVERFRRMYPMIPLLGLKATSVRYAHPGYRPLSGGVGNTTGGIGMTWISSTPGNIGMSCVKWPGCEDRQKNEEI